MSEWGRERGQEEDESRGGKWEAERGKKLMRRLEDVPDLRCLKEIKTGKHIEDCVCAWVHRRTHVCAGCSPSVYLSLFFLIRPWLKKMHLIVFPRLRESAASLMCSIYQRVTSGGLHLFTGSAAGATDWNIVRSNLWLVQLSDKMLAFDISANHWCVHVCTLYIGYSSVPYHIHITCLWLIYRVVDGMWVELWTIRLPSQWLQFKTVFQHFKVIFNKWPCHFNICVCHTTGYFWNLRRISSNVCGE